MKMLKDFIGFYKPHRKLFYWDMVCAMVIALADLFYPTIARNIINVYVPNNMWNMFLLWSAVLLVIYAACREKFRRRAELDKTRIDDL